MLCLTYALYVGAGMQNRGSGGGGGGGGGVPILSEALDELEGDSVYVSKVGV